MKFYRDIIMESEFIKSRNLSFSYDEINISFYYNSDEHEFIFYNDTINENMSQLQNVINDEEKEELHVILDNELIDNNMLNIIFPQDLENNITLTIKEYDCSKKYNVNNINFSELFIDLGGYHINKDNINLNHFFAVNDKFTMFNDNFFVINDSINYESEITRQ